MPLRDALNKMADRLEAKISQRPPPPPIPHSSKPAFFPGAAPQQQPQSGAVPVPYWSPLFHPSRRVSDEFKHDTGQNGWGNNEAQNYVTSTENSFYTPSGQLVLRAIANSRAPSSLEKYTSARLNSMQKLARQQGCLTVRLTAPSAAGVWPAMWLLPSEPFEWPYEGEIDIFEAWNSDPTNHACLHWGHFNGQDSDKHRVVETPIPGLQNPRGMQFDLVWQQPADGKGGKLVWYIDGKPVMKATIPSGTRRISDWRVVMNVAMGGNVCQGVIPADGYYDLIIHSLQMTDGPPQGWKKFEDHWRSTKEGHTM